MTTPKALAPFQAKKTLAASLGPIADRIRQTVAVGLGIRPYRVFLIHTEWSGQERGEGLEQVVSCMELLPAPRVRELTNLQNTPFAAGTLERGVLQLDRISTSYTEDQFQGMRGHEPIPENVSFYWEVVEDGRADNPAERRRCRYLGGSLRPDSAEWKVYLERMDEDRERSGMPGSRVDAEDP